MEGSRAIPGCQLAFSMATGVSLPEGLVKLFSEEIALKEFLGKVQKGITDQSSRLPVLDRTDAAFGVWQAAFRNLELCARRGIHTLLPVEEEKTNEYGEVVATSRLTYEDRKAADPTNNYKNLALAGVKSHMIAAYILNKMKPAISEANFAACNAELIETEARIILGLSILLSGKTPANCPVYADDRNMPGRDGPCAVMRVKLPEHDSL